MPLAHPEVNTHGRSSAPMTASVRSIVVCRGYDAPRSPMAPCWSSPRRRPGLPGRGHRRGLAATACRDRSGRPAARTGSPRPATGSGRTKGTSRAGRPLRRPAADLVPCGAALPRGRGPHAGVEDAPAGIRSGTQFTGEYVVRDVPAAPARADGAAAGALRCGAAAPWHPPAHDDDTAPASPCPTVARSRFSWPARRARRWW